MGGRSEGKEGIVLSSVTQMGWEGNGRGIGFAYDACKGKKKEIEG